MSAKSLALSLCLALAASAPSLAQERSDEPTDKLAPTGRTAEPTGPAPRKGHAEAPPVDEHGGASEAPSAEKPAHDAAAPWSWPWGGSVRSPGWTQDENWFFTDFWLMDVGHAELQGEWVGDVSRRKYAVDQEFVAKARIGLLPHIELGITENATLLDHDHLRQEGNEISGRIAFWDYGTVPLNPALEVIWHPRHEGADGYAARALIGGELLPGLMFAANASFEGETGGNHDYEWGFHGGIAYALIHEVLHVGCEGGVKWHWDRDHDKSPFRDTAPTLGPTVLFRPLALVKREWGALANLTVSSEFGLRDDNDKQPFMRAGVLLAFGF